MEEEKEIYTASELTDMAKRLFKHERAKKRLDGWFLAQETFYPSRERYLAQGYGEEYAAAGALCDIAEMLPLELTENHVFAGTQDDAFARSYALINPSFKVEEFNGYCDPTAVFGDIEPNEEFPKERIEAVREKSNASQYVASLREVYHKAEPYTSEVAYFIEQVTGHLIPDVRPILQKGVLEIQEELYHRAQTETDKTKKNGFLAFAKALEASLIFARRYREMALEQLQTVPAHRKEQLQWMADTLQKVPAHGAENLYEAIQSFILVWQCMCLEQAPNPFAFSVGNADRIFEPYRGNLSREKAAALFRHFLVFFNVADRSWAISQNVLLGGRDENGNDLTNESTYALLDAYYDMNLPQPILSVKLHRGTPHRLYREMGRFFFSPGVLTPSLFNDDSLYEVMLRRGVDLEDIKDTSVAGCQEPLIMGKDNGNTTNSWLNLPKILELTLTGGVSLLTGKKLFDLPQATLENVQEVFWKNVETVAHKMEESANGATASVSYLRVPFLSCLMGGVQSGIDTRDIHQQGTKYNGSGCLIHGVSVVADSFVAIERLLKERKEDASQLLDALRADFKGYESLQTFLLGAEKFGNHLEHVDQVCAEVTSRAADIVRSLKNPLGNAFRPDFSSPSTHLLYGYWVGATPDGRQAREMISYGVDPLYGSAENGLGFRMLSNMELPFEKMDGGYASHLGIDPQYFTAQSYEEKGEQFQERVITPLFFNPANDGQVDPFYLYVNVTTPEILRKVLANPEKYAPSGVYIMRIHGTFVNFLDLSPAIQKDIIKRLDLKSTTVSC